MEKRIERGDRMIAFAVMIQSPLVILQTILIGVFHMEAGATTIYRVLLTAFPMVVAIFIGFKRNPVRFVLGYAITIVLFVFTIGLHPLNEPYVLGAGLRIFLPVVLPSLLCLSVVTDYCVVEKMLYKISWVSSVLVIFYLVNFFRGLFVLDDENMALSYACLLPLVSIYSHRKAYDMIMSVILFIAIIAIGSRGPALCFGVYLVMDLFQYKSKWRFVLLVLIILFFVSLPILYSWLASVNIRSRTLSMFVAGTIGSDSGRGSIASMFFAELVENPVLGIGLYGDRLHEGIAYCHNVFLEILLDFGLLIGPFLIIFGLISLLNLYVRCDMDDKNRILRYLCALVLPLMFSGSYIQNSKLAIFISLCVLISRERKNQKLKQKINHVGIVKG